MRRRSANVSTAERCRSQTALDESIRQFSAALNAYPAAYHGNPLNLILLQDGEPIQEAGAYLRQLDGPELSDERREYLAGLNSDWPFPTFDVEGRPDPWRVSDAIFEHYDKARALLARQCNIGRMVERRATQLKPDIVVLMVVDGLSYYDLPARPDIVPCFVDGVTTTDFGYRQVIGRPPISQRLFALGYGHQLGFTFFDTEDNPLARDLYALFGSSQLLRIEEFGEAIERIRSEKIVRGYIQITAPGLDEVCHAHRDKPPFEQYVKDILNRFEMLIKRLKGRRRSVLAFLTADHGIIRREHLKGRVELVTDLSPQDLGHPRHITGARRKECGRVERCGNQTYTLLRMPYLTRQLKRNEWGVHGGISAWESLVPLVIREN